MAVFEYKNGRRKEMPERYVRVLERLGKGRVVAVDNEVTRPVRVIETRSIEPESELATEISPATGKPKRQYKRRDMKAEE